MRRFLAGFVLCLIACGRDAPEAVDVTPASLIEGQAAIPYPPELFTRRIEGQVMLYLFVDSSGTVVRDSTRVSESSGQALFDAAALEAAPALRFHPARRGTTPVSAPIQVPIKFRLPDSSRKAVNPQ